MKVSQNKFKILNLQKKIYWLFLDEISLTELIIKFKSNRIFLLRVILNIANY